MGVFGSEIHIVTFLISLFEITLFFYQVVYYLSRPEDKTRLYYLILLYLLIQYNLVSGLLPDPNITVDLVLQNIVAFSVALTMAMYFPFYFYKAYDLKGLRFYAYGGSLVFLLVPFMLFFLVPYLITHDLELSRRIVVVVPFLYGLSFLYSLRRAIFIKNKEKVDINRNEIIGMYIGVMFWCSLPIIAFFETNLNTYLQPIMNFHNGSQVVEVVSTNCGLLVITVLFIRRTVRESRAEYKLLQELNSDLSLKISERTRELELANEQRTHTFINLAHETKTPLMLINNYLQDYIAQHGETKELKVLKTNVDKLSTDIVNFFDIERVHKGFSLYDHSRPVSLSRVLSECLEIFKPYASKRNIELVSSIEEGLVVEADVQALTRIINNIVENAIKYTQEQGRIEVKACQLGSELLLTVKDNGLGIEKELCEKIFIPYYQIKSAKKSFQGMGLGLTIVKMIVDSLGGKIEVESDAKQKLGTEITVTLPKSEKTEGEKVEPVLDAKFFPEINTTDLVDYVEDDDRPIIMIVEDNLSLLLYMIEKLKDLYNIYVCKSGNEALEKLKSIQQLDLIVSDVMMDDGDGLSFFHEISKQKRYRHLPLIFVTAKNTVEDKLEALSMGAIDYLHKPFLMDELVIKINSLLKNIQRQRNALVDAASRMLMDVDTEVKTKVNDRSEIEHNCRYYKLTDREVEIVHLLVEGCSNKLIGDRLFISDKTVAKHVQNIFEKVGVNSRVEMLKKMVMDVNYKNG